MSSIEAQENELHWHFYLYKSAYCSKVSHDSLGWQLKAHLAMSSERQKRLFRLGGQEHE